MGMGCPFHGVFNHQCISCTGLAMQGGAGMQNHVMDSLVYIGGQSSGQIAISNGQGSISLAQPQNPRPFVPDKPTFNKKLLLLGR